MQMQRVQTPEQLETYLNGGLAELYKSVFSEAPWEEDFSLAEARQGFIDYFNDGGIIFVATDEKQKPAGFIVSAPLTKIFNAVRQVGEDYAEKSGLALKDIAYLAEDGVAKECRQQGVSGQLKRLLLAANDDAGIKAVLLRTSVVSYGQISAVNKAGFAPLKGVFQQVASKRLDGTERSDTRSLYVFDAGTKAAGADALERARIVRLPDGGDKVVISSPVAAPLRRDLIARIKANYPTVTRVSFSKREPKRNVVFSGKMYVARSVRP